MVYTLPLYYSKLNTLLPKLFKEQHFAPKLVKKSMNNLLNEETKLKCKEKHILSEFKIVTLRISMQK